MFRLQIHACVRRVGARGYEASAAAFPEVSCVAASAAACLERLRRGVLAIARDMPPLELLRRQSPDRPRLRRQPVTIEPPSRIAAWESPLTVAIPVARWSPGEDAHVAWVPPLGIQVLARTVEEREAMIEKNVRAALLRQPGGLSLASLARLGIERPAKLVSLSIEVPLRSPKQRAMEEEQETEKGRQAVLKQVATDISHDKAPGAFARDAILRDLADILTGRPPRSVLLVGQSGVGKSAIVRELARRRDEFGLGEAKILATSGAQLVAGMSGFGMWQDRCRQVCDAAERAGAILHLGSLWELSEVGRGGGAGVGIASFLQPALLRGRVLAIAECLPEQFALLERSEPKVLQPFEVLKVEEPGPAEFREILEAVAKHTLAESLTPRPPISAAGMDRIERLHARYASVSARPGRAVRFVRNLLQDHFRRAGSVSDRSTCDRSHREPLTEADVIEAFARETGLPLFLLDDRVPFVAADVRNTLTRRVRGQAEAVEQVVQLLAVVKARISRPGKPLASLLFIGPTGVGKTELARTLAAFLFGDENRMSRFDMSEFNDPVAARRLVGLSGDEGLLTSRVREQPFSVVLLDEFEKAHASVFDLLLQVLGEGRLTDGAGRLADFSNAVVVCTSNLGAEGFQQGSAGFVSRHGARREHFIEAVRGAVRPELFNRFDSIVPFEPLAESTLREIAESELTAIRQRDGLRFRATGWDCGPEVTAWLAKRGYDPVYGARPLKRTIERELLAPLAEQLNAIPAASFVRVSVSVEKDSLTVGVCADESKAPVEAVSGTALPPSVTALRRLTGRLLRCSEYRHVRNEVSRLDQSQTRERKRMLKRQALNKPWSPPPDFAADASRLDALKKLAQAGDDLMQILERLEDDAWLNELLESKTSTVAVDPDEFEWCRNEWLRVLYALYSRRFARPNRITLAVFSEHPPTLVWLAEGYLRLAATRKWTAALHQLTSRADAGSEAVPRSDDQEPLHRKLLREPLRAIHFLAEETIGVMLQVEGAAAFLQLQFEDGVHSVVKSPDKHEALVFASDSVAAEFDPPAGLTRRGAIGRIARRGIRRTYDLSKGQARDSVLDAPREIREATLPSLLDRLTLDRLRHEAEKQLDS